MLRTEILPQEGIIVVTPEGPLEKTDFEQLAAEVDAFLEAEGTLNGLIVQAPTFPGWQDFAGLIEHVRFVRGHHRQVRRVAVLTDSDILETLPKLAGHFVATELKSFAADAFDPARQWILQSD